MSYIITQAGIESITDSELAMGTMRFLPPLDQIPREHWGWFKGVERNIYFRIAEQMYTGDPPPPGDITFNPGFTGAGLKRCLDAHIRCVYPEYQHKMAGIAYMLATIMTIKEK